MNEAQEDLPSYLQAYLHDPGKELEILRMMLKKYKIEDADVNPEYL